jgi:type IV secretion system protein VirB3
MNKPREVVFHQSANRPATLLGCDRELVLWAALVAVLIFFALMSFFGFALAFGFWLLTMAVLRRMGKADPLLRDVYLKHIRYNAWYSAQSHRRSPTATIPANWR